MAVNTTSGTEVAIATTPWTSALSTVTAYEGLTWVVVGELETLGDVGDQFKSVTFAAMTDSREREFKTIKQGGKPDVVCGRDPLDVGQAAMRAASLTKFVWPIRVTYDDSRAADYTDSKEYFGAQVMGSRTNIGNAESILRRTFGLTVETDITPDDSNFVT